MINIGKKKEAVGTLIANRFADTLVKSIT